MRHKNKDSDLDENSDEGERRKPEAKQFDKKETMRGANGIILPDRNAFDFIERPDKNDVYIKERKNHYDSGKGKLMRTLMNMRKDNIK